MATGLAEGCHVVAEDRGQSGGPGSNTKNLGAEGIGNPEPARIRRRASRWDWSSTPGFRCCAHSLPEQQSCATRVRHDRLWPIRLERLLA